jgi:erythromycin esterase-like protein
MPLDRAHLQPLRGSPRDYDALLEAIGDRRVVLIGEASHGTHEFYRERAVVTRRLIVEKGFRAVAAEADWPDAYRVNRYVHGQGRDRAADAALSGFRRFPAWMWRNDVVHDFVTWLRAHNQSHADAAAGFYGLDLYSLFTSIGEVLRYLDREDPEAAKRARILYSCFDHFHDDPQAYGYGVSYGIAKSCEDEVVHLLAKLREHAGELMRAEGDDTFFDAEQNARLVKNAEEYYRSMFRGRISSWNLRDEHMFETLLAIQAHLEKRGDEPKIVVWAHNSHLGDARATEMGDQGELNVGQLVREHFGPEAANIGFSTYTGTVTAASDWDGPAETKRVRPGLPGSYEALFHDAGVARFLVMPPDVPELHARRLQRAIGVIYRPETERQSHYFGARLAAQFDAMIHIDETSALAPLEKWSQHPEEAPETYPSGI